MNEKALITLEYNKIISILSSFAISTMGKELAGKLKPISDIDEITRMQQETTEAANIILKKGSLPLGGIKDLRESIKRALVGGVLSIEELLHVSDFMYVCRKVINYNTQEVRNVKFEKLEPLFSQLVHIKDLEKEILRCIANSQEVHDAASQTLYDIRRNIKSSNDRIKEQLNSIIHSGNHKNMLQDNVITIRNGRFCVPVKQEYKSSFQGMVHDQSASGATLFIEPISVVSLNNKIKELLALERTEINKILKELSMLVAEHADIVMLDIETLKTLDFIFAKGELSLSMNATEPIFNRKKYLNIMKARHPLLDQSKVVPTDIYIGKDFNTLLITGPNTGGKTVALKTLGIFTLMGQAGLHIPASDNSELAVFDEVFADIGDEQSIEQSLSTFSSHMSNIVKILEKVTADSLVLLDELGAGTDPTEGAALAIAILQHLFDSNVRTAVTTHYSELKVFALETKGVENASCEFDVETLRPTYKLLIGVPGKSNAFAISEKLGLPNYIVNDAKKLISQENTRFEDVITDLEISKKSVMMEQEKIERYRKEAEALKIELSTQKDKIRASRDKIMLEARDEARSVLQKAKNEADEMTKELQRQLKSNASHKDIELTKQRLREKLNDAEKDLSAASFGKRSSKSQLKSVKKGESVFIHSMNSKGVVLAQPDINNEVLIQAGIMKIKVNIKDLSLSEREASVKVNTRGLSHSVKKGKSQNMSPEINLLGCMVDEGVKLCEKYLDDAYLSGLGQVSIIHGKGTGALRAGIHNYLKGHSHVDSFRLGTFGEGEAGVTIVTLK